MPGRRGRGGSAGDRSAGETGPARIASAGTERLVDGYTLVVFDLDGVIYLIDRPIPGAVEAVGRLHAEGRAVAYATNNASRRSSEVADLLTGMGVPARAGGGAHLRRRHRRAARVTGCRPARRCWWSGRRRCGRSCARSGLRPVSTADEQPAAVAQGYGPQVGWADLAEASLAVRAGALWYATNTDRTLPSPRGPLPGNGSLVAVLRTALERDPDVVVGKPESALFATAARRGRQRPHPGGGRPAGHRHRGRPPGRSGQPAGAHRRQRRTRVAGRASAAPSDVRLA